MLTKNLQHLPDSIASWLNYTPYLLGITLCKFLLASTAWFCNILSAGQILIIGILYKTCICLLAAGITALGYYRAKHKSSPAARTSP